MKTFNRYAILYHAIAHRGEWNPIAHALKERSPYKILEYPFAYTTLVDLDYPSCFKTLRYPPWILFYQGDLSLLKQKGVAIIGARDCTLQAKENTRIVTNLLKSRYVIISGLAKGIDTVAHQNAMDHHTIGFIGCGIDQIYPKENTELFKQMAKEQLIISEYPMGVSPLAHHFPWRNRLIAASCSLLVVVQARYKSGTMHTVNACLELSKPIYCLPSAFEEKDHRGCNWLIQNGAQIIVSEEDLREI